MPRYWASLSSFFLAYRVFRGKDKHQRERRKKTQSEKAATKAKKAKKKQDAAGQGKASFIALFGSTNTDEGVTVLPLLPSR